MSQPTFHFALEPALIHAIAQRDDCARDVTEVRALLDAQLAKLDELEEKLQLAVQRQRGERDKLLAASAAGAGAQELIDLTHFLEVLREDEARWIAARAAQRKALAFLRERLKIKQEELAEKMNRVSAFEKLKEGRRQEHEQELAAAEQEEIDEAALQCHLRKRRRQGV